MAVMGLYRFATARDSGNWYSLSSIEWGRWLATKECGHRQEKDQFNQHLEARTVQPHAICVYNTNDGMHGCYCKVQMDSNHAAWEIRVLRFRLMSDRSSELSGMILTYCALLAPLL